MDIRVLRCFIQVARDESITKAAKALHISQPALSRQMKELEEELQAKLFTRTNYAVRLTDEGMRLRLRAEDIVAMADQTVREFTEKDERIKGDIRIGAAEGEAVRALGKCMHLLEEGYPDIRYHMYAGDTEMLKEKLDGGFLDFLVIAEEPDRNRYNSIPLPMKDRWGVIMRKDDALAEKDAVTKKDLRKLPLIVSRQAMHQDLGQLFGEDVHRMRIAADYDLAHNAGLLVQEGFGYLLSFDRLADLSEASGLVFRPLTPELFTQMHMVFRRYQIFSPQADLFLKTLRENFDLS